MFCVILSMMSAIGSLSNIFQTGWLFSFLIKKDFSIPIITSFAGIFGATAMILCVCSNRVLFLLGSIFIIISYGFASPTAPAIMSVNFTVIVFICRQKAVISLKAKLCRLH